MAVVEITYKEMRELFARRRRRDAHKGDYGRVLIVAGSKGMAGAAVLCARAALRAGAGLATLSVQDELLPIVQAAVPEATCIDRMLSAETLSGYDAVAIGPGLGVSAESRETVYRVLENYGGELVLDADALNIIAGTNVTFDADTIITPHPGEAARLLGASIETVQANRENAAIALAEKFGCIAILKGAGTLVASPEIYTNLYINSTGNPGMATGGSGDVLTGVIASLAAQGMPPLTAARAGVYIHGHAGDIMAKEFGEYGLIASDLTFGVARAIKYLADNPMLD